MAVISGQGLGYRGEKERVHLYVMGGYEFHPGDRVHLALKKNTGDPKEEYAYIVVETPFGVYEGNVKLHPYPNAELSDVFAIEIPDPIVDNGVKIPRYTKDPSNIKSASMTIGFAVSLDGEEYYIEHTYTITQILIPPDQEPPKVEKVSHPEPVKYVPYEELYKKFSP